MKSSARLISLIIIMVVIGLPTVILLNLLITQSAEKSIQPTIIYIVAVIVIGFLTGTLNALGIHTSETAANMIESFLSALFMRFEKKYIEHLIYRHRLFHTKGLSEYGDFALELEKVFVELKLAPLNAPSEELGKSIWEILDPKAKTGQRLVVIGSPGSGKTTLLRRMTMALCRRRQGYQYPAFFNLPFSLPVFLTLREHSDAICTNPNLPLSDAIQSTLSRLPVLPPKGWFSTRLQKGQCMIMMDGLDEIADPIARSKVADWVQNQMTDFSKNHFVISSRPYGYENNPLGGVKLLGIKPFTHDDIVLFMNNWYLANEIMRNQKDDPGVRITAKEKAEDLLRRINLRQALAALAVNPLLLTMIANVHSFKETLPGRRVELFRDIFDVSLRRRQDIFWQQAQLRPDQILKTLKPLAYHMMVKNLRAITAHDAVSVIEGILAATGSNIKGGDFLRYIDQQSELILEMENDQYGFAHLTFQEYLASAHIFDDRTGMLEKELINNIDSSWWAETILLYTAQTDATAVISACLQSDSPSPGALSLAIDCVTEALTIEPRVRSKLDDILDQSIASKQSERRRLAAEAKLSSRLRWMHRIDSTRCVDSDLITNIEYQLFLDEMRKKDEFFYPDHWVEDVFPDEHGKRPVVGVRPSDVARFCKWLTDRDIWRTRYRMVKSDEVDLADAAAKDHGAYWVVSDNGMVIQSKQPLGSLSVEQDEVEKQLVTDLGGLLSLGDAIKWRAIPRKTTDELLRDAIPMGTLYTGREKFGVAARALAVETEFRRVYENAALLVAYEVGAQVLSLEFDKIIQSATGLFLESRGDRTRIASWLPPKSLYLLKRFDLDEELAYASRFLNSEESRHSLDNSSTIYLENIIRALALLRLRRWVGIVSAEPINRQKTYEFLRWYARLCAASLGYVAYRGGSYQASRDTIRRDMIKACERLIAALVFLEERVQGKRVPFEGILIIKEQGSLTNTRLA